MSKPNNIARDSGQSRRGVIVRITRKNMCWFRRFISLNMNQHKFNKLMSQDELIMKQMDFYTDKGILKRIKVLKKCGDIYTIGYSSERMERPTIGCARKVKDLFVVEYNARKRDLNFLQSNWRNQQSDLYEQASRTCENVILIIYFLYATGYEIVDDKEYELERFGLAGLTPKDLVDGKKGTA